MKILHINTSDRGGAATACIRIHKALLDANIDSKVLVLHKRGHEHEVYQFNYWENTRSIFHSIQKRIKLYLYKRKMRKLYQSLPPHTIEFSFPNTIYDITEHPLYKEADLIQLNWITEFVDEPSFFTKNKKPLVWRMSDLYACGGGNHYETGFPFEAFKKYLSENYKIREKALQNQDLHLVPISRWAEQKAQESSLLKKYPTKVIHNGVDLNVFKPYDKAYSRYLWQIPTDKTVILVGGGTVKYPRKGIMLLLDVLKKWNRDDVHFCCFGDNDSLEDDRVQALGGVHDERLLATLYSAVDFFLMTSLEETFGQVTLESIACGTPVISFPNGGSRDIIKDGINGVLTEDFTAESLFDGIEKALAQSFDREVIRKDAVSRFNIDDKAQEYIDLYRQILNK